jgi:tRNA modification GTPase
MEGVRRAQDRINLADINIAVLPITDFHSSSGTSIAEDASRGCNVDPIVLEAIRKNPHTLVLINKMDLSGPDAEKIMSRIQSQLWPNMPLRHDLEGSNGVRDDDSVRTHGLWGISCQTGDGVGQFLQDFVKILKEKYVSLHSTISRKDFFRSNTDAICAHG